MKPVVSSLLALGLLLAALPARAKPFVIRADGTRVEGESISSSADASGITVTLVTGQGRFDFKPGQYREAGADKPADFDAANAAAAAKDFAKADEAFQRVIRQNIGLGWDIQAAVRAINMHVQRGDGPGAARIAELIGRLNKAAISRSPDMQWVVWKAQVANKEFDKVEMEARKAIAEGAPDLAARAYMARGDSLAAKSLHKEAVLDYLRVALLFESQKEVAPEALYKAAQSMEALKDATRAKEMYARLAQEHPRSPFAELAKAKGN
jgi:tetratricopeptide (TPR) repeat protein